MLIRKYLTKEIFHTMLTILLVLMIIMIANTFVRYLSEAASGSMSLITVFKMMALIIPKLLAFILPVSLFLAILFVYGKLFAQSELLVMMACGLSWRKLFQYTLAPIIVVMIVTGVIMLWVQPLMRFYQNSINNSSTQQSVSLIQAGQFLALDGGREVIYIGSHNKNNLKVGNVFVYIKGRHAKPTKIIKAPYGYQYKDSTGANYMVLKNGYQYQFHPGMLDFNITHFQRYAIRVDGVGVEAASIGVKSMSTQALLRDHSLSAQTELQWRLSIPIAVFVLALLGIGMSYVKPRQGRFGQILPAIMVFIIYFNLLTAGRSWFASGSSPAILGLWWVHAVFFIIAIYCLWVRDGRLWWRHLK